MPSEEARKREAEARRRKERLEKRRKNVYLSVEALDMLDGISAGNDSFAVEKLIRDEAERRGLMEKGRAS